MIRYLLIAAVTALVPFMACAQQNSGEELMAARCGQGGCTCALLDVSQEDLEFLLGPEVPANATRMTLVSMGGKTYFSPRTADEVHRAAGGTGRCEVTLFAPMVPRDGLWQGSVRVRSMTGCLPQVAQMVPPVVDEMGSTMPITWNGRFDPAKFDGSGGAEVIQWTETAPGRFKGRLNIPSNAMLDVSMELTSTLLNSDRATASMQLRIRAGKGANAAVLAAAGMANCRASVLYDFRRLGD